MRSGIADAEGCKKVVAAYRAANAGAPPTDPRAVAKFMVQRQGLTPFQAAALIAESPSELRVGPFLIRSDKCPPPFGRWLEATLVADSRAGLLLRASRAAWGRDREQRLKAHQAIDGVALQPFETVDQGELTYVFSSLPAGRCLSDILSAGSPLAPNEVCRVGIAVSQALQALHSRDLVHGQVRPDRVWMGSKGQVILLRDPSFVPGDVWDPAVHWLDQLEPADAFAASDLPPEDRGADLYSLGCLLFHAAAGRRPFTGSTPAQILHAHRREIPEELASAVHQGSSGDPLFRVIAHAMAKDCRHRFASAEKLSEALQAVSDWLARRASVRVAAATGKESIRGSNMLVQESAERSYSAKAITPPPGMSTDPLPPPASRRRRKRRSLAPWVLGVLGFAVLLLVVGLLTSDPDAIEDPPKPSRLAPPAVIPPVSNRQKPMVSESGGPDSNRVPESNRVPVSERVQGTGYRLVEDERLLFTPPYDADAAPPPLNLLPPGPAVIITIRPTSMVNLGTQSSWIADLSPELRAYLDSASTRLKSPLDSIRRLTIALHPGVDGWPESSLMAEFSDAVSQETLMSRLGVSAAQTSDGDVVFVGEQEGGDAYYWIATGDSLVSQVAVGSLSRISEIAALDGNPIPLPRSSQSLWEMSCIDSELVALITPNFLFADGRELIKAVAPELSDPLRQLLQPDVSAALVSLNLQTPDRVFVEALFAPSGGISEAALMHKVKESVESWPAWTDRFILESVALSSFPGAATGCHCYPLGAQRACGQRCRDAGGRDIRTSFDDRRHAES